MQYFDPKTATLNLSPRTPSQQQEAQSVGYFNGEVPSIIIHVDGRKTELFIGQCIPTGGHRIAIENPYGRTARVTVMYDAPPSLTPVANVDDQQGRFVTYYGTFDVALDAAEGSGCGLLLKEGRALIEVDTYYFSNVYVLPRASLDFLATKPAAYMPNTLDFKHPSGAVFDDLTCIYGLAAYAESVNWIVAAGYPPEDKHFLMQDRYKTTVQLEAGSAMFVVGRANKKFMCNITAVDCGVLNGPSYV